MIIHLLFLNVYSHSVIHNRNGVQGSSAVKEWIILPKGLTREKPREYGRNTISNLTEGDKRLWDTAILIAKVLNTT